ncbi:hypothetical protein TrLO_g13666 [Triparma laevis f. longispina]|uniref:Glutathione S-transferase n=1 Tax=Triparma laevis f. longispina TaxID=1714387 RepID=A0A9W6ZUZ7_9STRA|nr:hypothetical protein TrLO_g13666 [Triparma laevis f. longispina]
MLLFTILLLGLSILQPTGALVPAGSLKLYGSQGSRSPLVNWYLEEINAPYTLLPPRPNPHPFNQVPVLEDGSSIIFESGAILLHIATKYDEKYEPSQSSWVVWANTCLDPICFKENERGQVLGTSLDQPNRRIDVLEQLLSDNDYIVNNEFSVADCAVASYLNYVPLFNPDANLKNIPNIVKYMQRCASRPKFESAFGENHKQLVLSKCEDYLSGGTKDKKIFGIF